MEMETIGYCPCGYHTRRDSRAHANRYAENHWANHHTYDPAFAAAWTLHEIPKKTPGKDYDRDALKYILNEIPKVQCPRCNHTHIIGFFPDACRPCVVCGKRHKVWIEEPRPLEPEIMSSRYGCANCTVADVQIGVPLPS